MSNNPYYQSQNQPGHRPLNDFDQQYPSNNPYANQGKMS